MTILSDIPDANEPVLSVVSSAKTADEALLNPSDANDFELKTPQNTADPILDGTDNVKLARRAVDEAISDISEFLTDDEVAEVADALHAMVNRWRNPPIA
jgi:hypothetical protein